MNKSGSIVKKGVAILGSTGSIGTQAIDVILSHQDKFEVEVLTAGSNSELLVEQARKLEPNAVVIADEDKYDQVRDALEDKDVKVYAGKEALSQVVEIDTVDIVLTALVGFAGLQPTVSAIKAGKNIALANKETLVVAGDIITQLAKTNGVNIYPVDSEHSAIFQCLAGEFHNPIEKIYLTASGGPFRGKTRKELEDTTKAQALKHPNWDMGAKITIDSASMMNKGLEVIEAKWLFGLENDQIDVIVHPESIVHSIVQFTDGSMKSQMGLPDMKLPIQYALAYPNRIPSAFPRFNFMDYAALHFEQPDLETFRNLALAYQALEKGGNMACILNAANEVAVARFLRDEVGFLQMSDIVESAMQNISFIQKPTLEEYLETDSATRAFCEEQINQLV